MTGTAKTEAAEFAQIYGLEVVEVPTHRTMVRLDQPDLVYKTEDAKFEAVVSDIVEAAPARPACAGGDGLDREVRAAIAKLLHKQGIPHEVLNAKQHAREAEIIAQAGRSGAVTVATNMAGRGWTSCGREPRRAGQDRAEAGGDRPVRPRLRGRLHGATNRISVEIEPAHDEIVDLGGLYVVGTERHESRRIDNQLRGRSGRQGDPGESRHLSLGDDLMRRFQGERVRGSWSGSDPRRCPHRGRDRHQVHRGAQRRSRRRTSRSGRTSSSTTR